MTTAGRVFKITKTKGSPIELPKDMTGGDTIEIFGDQLEHDHDSYIRDDFHLLGSSECPPYHLVMKNGQRVFGSVFCTSKIASLDAPDLQELEERALYGSKHLESVSLPALVTIDSLAFEDCPSLKSFAVPKGVTHIGIGPFAGCTSLESITVDPENRYYESIDGVLYLKAGDRPQEIEELYDGHALGRKVLVAYPSARQGVSFTTDAEIGGYAFCGARHLEEIHITGASCMGERVFGQAVKLRRLHLPASLLHITSKTFVMEGSMKWKGEGCPNFEGYDVDPDHPYITSKDGVLYSKDMKKLFAYPAGRRDENFANETVEEVMPSAFAYCQYAKRVSLPNVRRIGRYAFWRCKSIHTLDLPRLDELDVPEEGWGGCSINCEVLRAIRLGPTMPRNFVRGLDTLGINIDGGSFLTYIIVPDKEEYRDCSPDFGSAVEDRGRLSANCKLVDLPIDGSFRVDEPFKDVWTTMIGDELIVNASKKLWNMTTMVYSEIDDSIRHQPDTWWPALRVKRRRFGGFLRKVKILRRDVRSIIPDAKFKVSLNIDPNSTWYDMIDPFTKDMFANSLPRNFDKEKMYIEISIQIEIIDEHIERNGGNISVKIGASLDPQVIRDDVRWLWNTFRESGAFDEMLHSNSSEEWIDTTDILGPEDERTICKLTKIAGERISLPDEFEAGSLLFVHGDQLDEGDFDVLFRENDRPFSIFFYNDQEILHDTSGGAKLTSSPFSPNGSLKVIVPGALRGQDMISGPYFRGTEIGAFAFDGCTGLRDIDGPYADINREVTHIGLNPFIRCSHLTDIKVWKDNETFESERGVLCMKPEMSPTGRRIYITYPQAKNRRVFAPQGDVASWACYGNPWLETVDLSSSQTLGEHAFDECVNLKQIIISKAVAESYPHAKLSAEYPTVEIVIADQGGEC